ncbi:MAG: aspartate 1-decarboxylase, partial [Kocuria sp.]|nr:aspartate 1-decarboxylase [Kocuria sp.]
VHPGDLVILISYGLMDTAEAQNYNPHVVHVDENNKIVALGSDPADAVTGDMVRPPQARDHTEAQEDAAVAAL